MITIAASSPSTFIVYPPLDTTELPKESRSFFQPLIDLVNKVVGAIAWFFKAIASIFQSKEKNVDPPPPSTPKDLLDPQSKNSLEPASATSSEPISGDSSSGSDGVPGLTPPTPIRTLKPSAEQVSLRIQVIDGAGSSARRNGESIVAYTARAAREGFNPILPTRQSRTAARNGSLKRSLTPDHKKPIERERNVEAETALAAAHIGMVDLFAAVLQKEEITPKFIDEVLSSGKKLTDSLADGDNTLGIKLDKNVSLNASHISSKIAYLVKIPDDQMIKDQVFIKQAIFEAEINDFFGELDKKKPACGLIQIDRLSFGVVKVGDLVHLLNTNPDNGEDPVERYVTFGANGAAIDHINEVAPWKEDKSRLVAFNLFVSAQPLDE